MHDFRGDEMRIRREPVPTRVNSIAIVQANAGAA